jgi:hypothetical protein
MSGGKGGSSSTEIPEWLKEPLLRNITRAEAIQSQEYTPYQGPQVAAFTAPQMQAFSNIGSAAEAFGMAPMGQGQSMMTASIPKPQEFAGGIRGYSSIPLYEEAQAKTAATPEGQANLAIRKELYSPEVKASNLARFKEKATGKTEVKSTTNNLDNSNDSGSYSGAFGGKE